MFSRQPRNGAADHDDGMREPVADQPTGSGADSGPPAGDRPAGHGSSTGSTPAAPLTVAELLARSGTVPGRRAERRESAEATGRQQQVAEDGQPSRPPLRGGIRRDPPRPSGPAPSVVPRTGWQPAMPEPVPEPVPEPEAPAAEPLRRPAVGWATGDDSAPRGFRPPPRTAPPGAVPAGTNPPRPVPAAPAPPRPAEQPPAPVQQPPTARPAPGPSAAAGQLPGTGAPARPVPARPVPGSAAPVVRSAAASSPPPPSPVRPAVQTPAAPSSSLGSLAGSSSPVQPAPVVIPAVRVVPPVSVTPAPPLPGGSPYPSVPVPGVRRSLPLPPIPGRDIPAVRPPEPTPPRIREPMSPGRRRLTRAALALVALLGLVAAYYVGLYFYVDRSIERVDALVTDGPEVLAPQLQESAETYLVVGTGLPGRSGLAAVSALIAHVPAGGEQAVLVSVPPTALGDTPTCRDADGDVRPAVTEPFASALLSGGPSCLVRSVQQVTGLRIDHYLALDLGKLPGMVDTLGDIPVCLPWSAAAAGADSSLPAGENRLTGDEAAAYLRPSGTGSDVTGAGAAQREQLVLTSTLRTALGKDTLADPLTLTRFLSTAGDAFTLDADTTLGDVRALGATLGALPADAVQRTQIPVARVGYVPAGSDQAAVLLDAAGTRELFDAVIDDGRLPAAAVADTATQPASAGAAAGTAPADTPSDPASADPVPEGTVVTVAPAGVTLDVLDATGGNRATEVADGLAAQGFRIGVRGLEPAAVDRTTVRYAPEALEPARTVAAAVPGSVLLASDEVGGGVQLVIGADYTGLAPADLGTAVPTTAAPAPVETEAGAASCS